MEVCKDEELMLKVMDGALVRCYDMLSEENTVIFYV